VGLLTSRNHNLKCGLNFDYSLSFQALLSCYLLEGCDGASKHCLTLYLLLDLVSLDPDPDSQQVNIYFIQELAADNYPIADS